MAGKSTGLCSLLRTHRKFLVFLLSILAVIVLLAVFGSRIRVLHPNHIKAFILGFGPWSPIVFIGIQILQVIFAPVPGQAAGFAGGYVFGWALGTGYSMIGLAIGSWFVLCLSRLLGRPFVERLNGSQAVTDFAGYLAPGSVDVDGSLRRIQHHGLLIFFLIMLLPAFPDDLVCFAAGLSLIPVWKLLAAAVFGRLPGMVVLNLLGDGVSRERLSTFNMLFIGICVVLTVLYLMKKASIRRFVDRLIDRLRMTS